MARVESRESGDLPLATTQWGRGLCKLSERSELGWSWVRGIKTPALTRHGFSSAISPIGEVFSHGARLLTLATS